MIDEKKLMKDIGNMVKPLTTPDGCGSRDFQIQAYNEGLIDAMETVNEQPKVGEWIPCSKDEPEDSGLYLVTVEDEDLPSIMEYSRSSDIWLDNFGCDVYEVVAWMSLPAPFKESED